MCGIAGFIDNAPSYDRQEVAAAQARVIVHRGPDDEGFHQVDPITFAFRRLSIIDLGQGHQPIYNADRSKVIIFNGEIYNYKSLREKLVARGYQFATNSDTEVLLCAYEEYGPAMFDHVRGMFGFAVWDETKQELFLARDFFGIKPLYYAPIEGGLVFGSEIKSILQHPKVEKKLNYQALNSYLSFQYSPLTESMFAGIYKLPPAHYLLWRDGKQEITKYWAAEFAPEQGRSFDSHVEELAAVLDDSISAHMVADVEVGSFLSSGVDSSFVAASFGGQKSFSVGFEPGGTDHYNETEPALTLARQIGLQANSKIITAQEYWDSFAQIQYFMDEPLADPACVPLYFVNKLAREQVKVCLSGEGADELFGGYTIYNEPHGLRVGTALPRRVRRGLSAVADKLPDFYGKNYLHRAALDLPQRFIGNAYQFRTEHIKDLITFPVDNPLTPQEVTAPFYAMTEGLDDATRMQHLDIHTWMVGDILLKADRMSMAHSIELRVPFLDKEVMKVAAKVPAKYRMDGQHTKMVFREVAKSRLPQEYYQRPKLGFPVPIRVWLREQQWHSRVRDTLTTTSAGQFFNPTVVNALLDHHASGAQDNSRLIWTLYTFMVWHEQYFGSGLGA